MTRPLSVFRVVDADPTGLLVRRPSPADRMVEDGVGLRVTSAATGARLVEDGAGLLVTPADALTAAPDAPDADRSPDPWEEQRLQAAADLLRWERKLEAAARKALHAWTAIVATAVLEDRYLTADAGGDQLPPDPNAVPPLAGAWQRIANAHILRTIGDLLGEVFARFLRAEELVSARPWQDAYLGDVANRLVGVADSTFELVRDAVRAGIDEGASIPTIRDRVQEALDTGGETSWSHRAQTIARTETIGAYNGGHHAAWTVVEELTGDPVHKVWLATIDLRTRDSHFRADGQRVPLGQPFRVGGHDLAFPGDPTAPAGEVINCRCTMLELSPDDVLPDVADRGFRDPGEVAAEIARRAEQDPPVVRAFDDPAASLQAAARSAAGRPDEGVVARMDGIYRVSYGVTDDPLLVDEGVVDPKLPALLEALGETVTAAGGVHIGVRGEDHYDPTQRRDENGKWTKLGVGISITVKDGPNVEASFAAPTAALAHVTFDHDLTGSDGKTYKARVGHAFVDHPDAGTGGMNVTIDVTDEHGKSVGYFNRRVKQTPDGPQVYHEFAEIDKAHQGLGLASEFNRRAEVVYRAAGVTHVATEAHSYPPKGFVGGYVWARRGFGWADPGGPKNVAKTLRKLSPKHESPDVDAAIERLQSGDLASMPTPFEVSELTSKRFPGDGRVGKAALLRESWNGVRWLPPEEPGHAEPDVPAAPKALTGPAVDKALADLVRNAPVAADYDPDLEFDALSDYRTSGYRIMNDHLRGDPYATKPTAVELENIDALREIADRHRLTQPVQVYRGMEGVDGFLPPQGKAVGTILTDPGFMSTSTDRGVADRFTDPGGHDSALLHITVPAGHPGIPMDALSGGEGDAPDEIGDEKEFVLPPGSSLRITGDERDAYGRRVLTAEVLPYQGKEAKAAVEKAVPAAPPAPRAPSAPAAADGAKLTPAQEKALGWIADPKGPVPRTDVLRRLQDGGLITAPPRGWDWDKSELTPAGRDALGLPAAGGAKPLEGEDAYAAVNGLVTAELEPGTPEHAALRAYMGYQYNAINFALRGGTDEHLPAEARDVLAGYVGSLTATADAHRLAQPVIVHRGVRDASTVLPEGSAVGSIVTDPGFMSTSTSAADAATFVRNRDLGAVFELTVPAGHPVLPIDGLMGDNGEDEVVLQRGSSFRVTGDRRDASGRRVITATVLPYTAPEPADAPAPAPRAVLSRAEADAMLSALVTQDLEPEADMALQNYILSGYRAINAHLRGLGDGDPHPDLLLEIDGLSDVADAHRLTAPIQGYRGIMAADKILPPRGQAVGTVVTDPAFMSVSIDRAVAHNFGNDRDAALFEFTVPEGHPAIPVDQLFAGAGEPLSQDPEREFEVILPPGSSFRITGETEDSNGRRVITATVLPYDPSAVEQAGNERVDVPAAAEPLHDPGTPDGSPAEPAPPVAAHRVLATPQEGDAFLREHFDPKALSKPEKEALGYWTSGNYRRINELQRTGALDVKYLIRPNEYATEPPFEGLRITKPAEYGTRTVHSADDIRALAAEFPISFSGGELGHLADQLDHLPAAIGKHQLPEDVALYRVAAMPELAAADPASLVGRSITDRGFVATSTSEKSAVLVTSQALGVHGDGVVLFEIRTPAGTPFGTPELPFGTVNGQKLGGFTRVQEVLLNPSEFRVVAVHDDHVDTSGLSLKSGAVIKPDAKAKREPTAVRRVVVERVGDAAPLPAGEVSRVDPSAPLPAPETLTPERVGDAAKVLGPARVDELTGGRGVDGADLEQVQRLVAEADAAPKVDAPKADAPAVDVPKGSVPAAAPDAPPLKLTAARVQALDYYAVPVAERSGSSPNYSVYMPLLRAGLIERDANGKYVATDAGHAARTRADATPVKDLAPDLPADVPPLTGEAAFAAVPRLGASGSAEDYVARTALGNYQGAGFAVVNQHLRGGEVARPEDAEALAATLDGVFAGAEPLGQPITVYRGSGSATTIFGDAPLEPGTTITDPAYLSTSTDRGVAGKFTQLTSDPAVLEIRVPAGTRAVPIDTEGNGAYESEVLLGRGTQLRVVSDTVERTISNEESYADLVDRKQRRGWTPERIEEEARAVGLVQDARRIRAEVVLADDRRDATPAAPADAAPAVSRPSAAPDAPKGSADAAAGAGAAITAEQAAVAAKAEKRRAAAAKKAEKQAAAEKAARDAELAARNDDAGVPFKLSYDYLSGLDEAEREDLEVHLIEGLAAGDPMAESRLDDLTLFNDAQAAEDRIVSDHAGSPDAVITTEVNNWLETNGRPGLTHPAVGGDGSTGPSALGVPPMKQVRDEYAAFLEEQWAKAEAATNGYMVTARGKRIGRSGMDMFTSKRGVADVMQYASDELLEWFESNRRITFAEFYHSRTGSPAYAERAAKDRAISAAIDRDRTALGGSGKRQATSGAGFALLAAARHRPDAPVEPTRAQLDAYAAGRAAFAAGKPATASPFDPAKDAADSQGRFVLWLRGYRQARRDAFVARRAAEGMLPDPTVGRLSWSGGDVLVLPPPPQGDDPAERLAVLDGELEVSAPPVITATARPLGHTVTAAGSGPGVSPSDSGDRPMVRTWKSSPYLAPFAVPTGDGRIFAVGSLTARELPLPLLFQPSSGMGHDGSVVVGRILAVEMTDAGIVASGDYLEADAATNPDLAKAIEQAVALTESGLGHVSVDLSDVVGELVDEDGNPVSMEDIFDAWDRGEDPKVLEQVSEGKLIACTQVATPAFEGAKIELSADAAPAAVAPVDGQAALQDTAGTDIGVGDVVDAETDDGSIRGEVTAIDEAAESVTVQPTDADGTPTDDDPLVLAPAAITVVTPAAKEKPDAEDKAPAPAGAAQEASLLAAAGPLRPPAAWFEDPKLAGPTALTITDDGRVFGHAALWDVCHVGFANTCVTPPSSPSGYKHFHTGEVVTEDGSRVAVGNLTLGGRHADVRLAYRSAIEHYDVQGAGAAVVRMYEDEHGIAFAGALTPGVTEEQIYDLRRSPVSGDWRRVGGELEMIGVLSVNAPGFPTPRFATDEAGRTALVAAPSVRPMDEEAIVAAAGGARRSTLSQEQLIARVTREATAAVRAEMAAERARDERAARLRGLATSIKADPRSRLQRLAATIEAPKVSARRSRLAELSAAVSS